MVADLTFTFCDGGIQYFVDSVIHLGYMCCRRRGLSGANMLSLSQSTGYAILAMSCLEGPDGKLTLARDIARRTGIPRAYLAKVLNLLVRSGLVHAKRGYRGGVTLARPASEISVCDVAEAVEGRCQLWGCLLGLTQCRWQRRCPAHAFWEKECRRIEARLRSIRLSEMKQVTGRQTAGCHRAGMCRTKCGTKRTTRS